LGGGKLVIKQRHTGLDLDKLRRELERKQGRPLTLACYLLGKSVRHALIEAL
jgi:hypothetical protein